MIMVTELEKKKKKNLRKSLAGKILIEGDTVCQ